MGHLFFDEESIYEISKPYLKFVTDGRTDKRLDNPKAICPFNFFKIGGIEMMGKKNSQFHSKKFANLDLGVLTKLRTKCNRLISRFY